MALQTTAHFEDCMHPQFLKSQKSLDLNRFHLMIEQLVVRKTENVADCPRTNEDQDANIKMKKDLNSSFNYK